MKTVNYLILALVFASCRNVVGAEQVETKEQAARMELSPEEQNKLNEALHKATTVEEARKLRAQGATLADLVTDQKLIKKFTSLLESYVKNPAAELALIEYAIEQGARDSSMTWFKKTREAKTFPPFLTLLMPTFERMPLDKQIERCKIFVQQSMPLDACRRTIHNSTCVINEEINFANRMIAAVKMPDLYEPARKGHFAEKFICRVGVSKAIYEEGMKQVERLEQPLLDSLPTFSVDLVHLVKGYLLCGKDGLKKIKTEILDDEVVQQCSQAIGTFDDEHVTKYLYPHDVYDVYDDEEADL